MTLVAHVGYIRLERCPVTGFRHITYQVSAVSSQSTPSPVNSLLHSGRTASLKIERLPVMQEAAG
jgi:hypothetical protein